MTAFAGSMIGFSPLKFAGVLMGLLLGNAVYIPRLGKTGQDTPTSSRRPWRRSVGFRVKALDCPDSKHDEDGQDDQLGNDESRIGLRWRQRVEESHLLESVGDQNKDIQIEGDERTHDVDPT